MGEKRDPKATGILKTNKIIKVSASLSVITLIVNGLNSPVKRYDLAKCVKKMQDSDKMLSVTRNKL